MVLSFCSSHLISSIPGPSGPALSQAPPMSDSLHYRPSQRYPTQSPSQRPLQRLHTRRSATLTRRSTRCGRTEYTTASATATAARRSACGATWRRSAPRAWTQPTAYGQSPSCYRWRVLGKACPCCADYSLTEGVRGCVWTAGVISAL